MNQFLPLHPAYYEAFREAASAAQSRPSRPKKATGLPRLIRRLATVRRLNRSRVLARLHTRRA